MSKLSLILLTTHFISDIPKYICIVIVVCWSFHDIMETRCIVACSANETHKYFEQHEFRERRRSVKYPVFSLSLFSTVTLLSACTQHTFVHATYEYLVFAATWHGITYLHIDLNYFRVSVFWR